VTATALAALLVAGIAIASCSGGGGDDHAASTSTTKPKTTVDIPLGDVTADSAGPPATMSADQSQRVLDAVTTYVKGATVQPLQSGQPATADFGAVFDPPTLASATSTDRAVVLDEGLPKVTGNLTVKAEPVTITGLGDQSGNVTLATARLLLDVTGVTKVKGEPLHVARQATFVLQPDVSGTWKVTAYDMIVSRSGAGLTPTTTSTAASSTTGAKK
jgi:ketosteroid isomerase-like protein